MKKIFYVVTSITIACNMQAMHEDSISSLPRRYHIIIPHDDYPPIITVSCPPTPNPPPTPPSMPKTPCSPPNSPYTSYCPSTTPPALSSSSGSSMADCNFVELTTADASMAIDLKLNQTSNRKYADHHNALQKFKDQAQQLINNLPKDDVHAYLSGRKALRELQCLHAIVIKKAAPSTHVEFSTEKGVYTRKIHHLCNKAIAAAQKKQHIRHMNKR